MTLVEVEHRWSIMVAATVFRELGWTWFYSSIQGGERSGHFFFSEMVEKQEWNTLDPNTGNGVPGNI